jgi:hypothetical protein
MERLILIVCSVFILGMTFVGTWLLRGNGLSELWPWSRPAGPPSGNARTSGIPNVSKGHLFSNLDQWVPPEVSSPG